MSTERDSFAGAQQQIDFVVAWATETGFRCAPVPAHASTKNAGVVFDEDDYLLLGIMDGTPSLYLTSGVVQRIREDRVAALEAANSWTRSNPAFPCFFADGPHGWDLVLQQKLPLQLVVDAPEFVKSCIGSMPGLTRNMRATAASLGLVGEPFRWTPDDLRRLAARSM